MAKNPPANAGDTWYTGSIPGLGRCPRAGNGNLLQHSCLEKLHGQKSLVGYSPWGSQKVRHDWTQWSSRKARNIVFIKDILIVLGLWVGRLNLEKVVSKRVSTIEVSGEGFCNQIAPAGLPTQFSIPAAMATLWESTTFIRAGISSRPLHLYTSRLYPCTRFSLQSLSRDQILGLKMELWWERQNKVNMSSSEALIKVFHGLGATTVDFLAEVVEILANSIWPLPQGFVSLGFAFIS